MKLVLAGVGGFRNRGVEAFTTVAVEQILKRARDCEISILTPMPEYDSQRIQQCGVRFVRNDFFVDYPRGNFRKLKRAVESVAGKKPWYENQTANMLIRSASALVYLGGDIFSSDYGTLESQLRPIRYAQSHCVPVILLGHSVGPFRTSLEADAWVELARKCRLITVREALTQRYVTSDLGVPSDLVRLTADPAFLLHPSSVADTGKMLDYYGVSRARPLLTLSISQGISHFVGASRKQHLQVWRRIITMMLENREAELLIIPHVQDCEGDTDDRVISTEIVRDFAYDRRVHIASSDHSASELKGLIAASEMIVAERMHAAIAGLSMGVCTVAVAYSVKAHGIMSDVLGPERARDGFVMQLDEFMKDDTACRAIMRAWQRRAEASEQLTRDAPRVKQLAERNFDLLLDAAMHSPEQSRLRMLRPHCEVDGTS